MTAAPPGLARSGGLRVNAYQNTGQEGGSSRRGGPSVGSGWPRESSDHRSGNGTGAMPVEARS
eukprot:3547789-Alexandrium_andersonii.AAC.1